MSVHWFQNICNISMYVFFVMHLPEDGYMSGRNMWEVYRVYNILSYTYVHLLVLISYPRSMGSLLPTFRYHLLVPSLFASLSIRLTCCPETSVTHYPLKLRNILPVRRLQSHRGESLNLAK
jgi:hypothetical protein